MTDLNTTEVTTEVSSDNPRSPLTFLSLPTEIRLEVYRHLFQPDHSIADEIKLVLHELVCGPDDHKSLPNTACPNSSLEIRKDRFPVGILRANSQICREACEVLYKEHYLMIAALMHVKDNDPTPFINKIGPVNSIHVQFVRIKLHDFFKVLEKAPMADAYVNLETKEDVNGLTSIWRNSLTRYIQQILPLLATACPRIKVLRLLTGFFNRPHSPPPTENQNIFIAETMCLVFSTIKECLGGHQPLTPRDVIVETYDNALTDSAVDLVKGYGWTLEYRKECQKIGDDVLDHDYLLYGLQTFMR